MCSSVATLPHLSSRGHCGPSAEWMDLGFTSLFPSPAHTLKEGQRTSKTAQRQQWRGAAGEPAAYRSRGMLRHTYDLSSKALLAAIYTWSSPQQGRGSLLWKRQTSEHCYTHSIRFYGFAHKKMEYLVYSAWISREEGTPEGTNG